MASVCFSLLFLREKMEEARWWWLSLLLFSFPLFFFFPLSVYLFITDYLFLWRRGPLGRQMGPDLFAL